MRRKITIETFIERSKEKHNEKYTYELVQYVAGDIHVLITCPNHGQFGCTPYNHLRGHGCPVCGVENRTKLKTKQLEQFIEDARKVHGLRYDYSRVIYNGAHVPIEIVCQEHGSFLQTPSNHTNRECKCPVCARENRISSGGELAVEMWLIKNSRKFIREMIFPDLINPRTGYQMRYDFFLPERNHLIEFDGQHHFEPIRIRKWGRGKSLEYLEYVKFKDRIKTMYAGEHGYKLIRIRYRQDPAIILDEQFCRS